MKTQSIFSRGRLSASVAPVVLGLAMISMPAFAQTTPAADDEAAAEGETIVVTGSLISNPNLKSASPVSVITSEEVELRQTNVAEEFLRQLPSAIPSIGSAVNNGNGGASFVNLRGIGAIRNLVLLDGQRIVPANLGGAVDLNNIPLALIERTDILTGGATTTYGADAVSGVVNFITKRDFSGIEATISEQITEKGDGNTFRADVTIGANFDDGRGNAVFSVGYQEADPVFQGDRSFSVNNVDSFSGAPAGSGTSVPGRITGTRGLTAANVPNTTATLMQIGTTAAGVPILAPRPGGAVNGGTRQIDPTTGRAIAPFLPFNFNPFNIFQTPFERFNIFGQARYEISDRVEVYTQGLFSKNTVKTIIAPGGSFGSTLTLPLSNPFLPTSVRNQLCAFNVAPNVVGVAADGTALSGQIAYTPRFTQAQCDAAATAQSGSAAFQTVTVSAPRRFVEAGTRNSAFTTTVFNYGLGFRGDVTDKIRYDVYGSYGESENVQRQTGNGLLSRLRQSVLATNVGGVPTCTVAAGGCVPINLFGAQGTITPQQLGFVTGVGTSSTTQTSLSTVKGIISGETGFALAETPIGFAVGVEYRKYGASTVSDLASQTPGEVLGNGAASPDVTGGYNVKEAFGELIIPIFEDQSFAKNLTLEAGGRYSDYSTAGKSYTYKVGGSYEPVDGLKFRGNYQRGARAPNIGELFSPQVTGLTNLANDPCQGAAPTTNANLRAICIAQGAPAGTIGSIVAPSAGQANATSGGNPNLNVEKTKTYTVGAVWQPSFVPKLSISVDYFNIKVNGAISSPTGNDIISACFGATPGNPPANAGTAACTSIRRNPLTGGLDGDASTTPGLPFVMSNLGRIATDGIDVSINYSRDLGFATYSSSFDGTWTNSNKFQATPTSVNRECVSFISANCGSLKPEFSWTQRTSLTFEDRYTLSLLWRHLSKFKQEPLDVAVNGPAFTAPGVNFGKINPKDYYDLSGRFELSDNVVLTVTVQNLLDSKPKVVGSNIGTTAFNSGNVFPSTFDPLGRRYAAAVKFKF